ncbi:MAG: FKBP-type peptidyl-prolyl cis-trans isomerase [Alistipes sp.]|jgi:hypothetical protein|nr:FKBP-type peptidyl-prolyl cis-trans isomerase [Alistipes sp.]MBQ5836519.1 FKBP-type peptidyl-prolyl cis-trans isomerase [Alistipes sp.]
MKRFFAIVMVAVLTLACDDEGTLLTERDNIEKFLTSTRRMVAEENLGSVIEDNPKFYTVFGRYAYRYIDNYYDADRENRAVVEWGDEVVLRFNAYTFTSTEPSNSAPYWSNVPEMIDKLGKHGDLEWSRDPLAIRLGTTDVIEGVERALVGCREQDSVQVFMTSSLGYGKRLVGSVPKRSSLAWYMKIEKVNKR